MIKLIGNFNTVHWNNYTVIAAKKKVVQGVVKGSGRKSSGMLQISQNTFYKVIEPFSARQTTAKRVKTRLHFITSHNVS